MSINVIKKWLFILFLGALTAFAPLSTDVYLGAMPVIQRAYGVSNVEIQLTLSVFFLVYAVMMLVWGPLSDKHGRKPVLLCGLTLYLLGSWMCASSGSVHVLIASRAIQAAGASSAAIVAFAIVRDHFVGQQVISRVLGLMVCVMLMSPIFGPVLGTFLLLHGGWHAIFWALLCFGCVLLISSCFVQETHTHREAKPFVDTGFFRACCQQFRHTPFSLAVIASSCNFAALFAFICASPIIYIKMMHLSTSQFSLLFSFNACACFSGSLFIRYLKSRISDRAIISAGSVIILCSMAVLGLCVGWWRPAVWMVAILCGLSSFSVSFMFPELNSHALSQVLRHNGLAASLLTACRCLLASLVSVLVGLWVVHVIWPLVMMVLVSTLIAWGAMFYYFRCVGASVSSG